MRAAAKQAKYVHKQAVVSMLQQQQERKISGPKQPDGAKLSFQEKMKLFAQEVGFASWLITTQIND